MKKFTGMLSLVVLLLSQGLTPFTYVYADSQEDCSPQESWNGESCVNKCSPRQSWDGEICIDHECTETDFYNGEECEDFYYYQCDYNQSRNGESCVDRCSPWQSWDGKTCKNQCASHQKVGYSTYYHSYICEDKCSPDAKLTENGCVCPTGESRNQAKFACIPLCNDLQDPVGNTCVNKPTYRISFNLLGGSKDSLDIPQNTPVRSLIQKEISVDSHDLTDFRYSKYVTINHATKLDMWIKWFKNYSGDPEFDPILFNIGTGSETVNLTEKDPVTEQFIYPNPINTGRDNNSVTFYGYGYGFHAIVTGNVLEVDGIPEGKSFDGWYTDSHFNNKLDIDEEVTDDLTLYGRIVAKVSFDTRGGNIIPDIFVSEGETLENKVTNPQRAYSDFVEWYDNPNFSGEPFNLSSEINSNITLYAKYNCKDDGLQHVLSPLYGYNEGINECFGYNTLNLGAFTLMDRNLGASNNGNWNSSSDRSAGYFYQWGNNYGFPAVFNTLGTGVLIGDGENSYTNSLYGYGWKKPDDASSDDYRYKSLWSELDPQGPCPSGWHVATDSEWRGIVDYLIKEKNYNYEKYYGSKIVTNNELANYLLFPKSNYIKSPINSGSLPELQSDSLGAAWANVYGYGFKIKPEDSATISINFDFPFSNDEFDFMPVRCFKDKTYITFKDVSDEDAWVPSPDIYGTLGFDGSTYTISEISNLPSEIYKLRNYVTFNFTGSDGSYLENQGIANLLSNEFKKSDGNAFVYVNYPRYTVKLHPKRTDYPSDTEKYEVLYLNGNDSFSTFTLPEIQKEGYEFMGWYTDKGVRLGKSYSGEITENLAEDGGEVDLYPHFKKTITITVDPNGNKIQSGEALTESQIVETFDVYNEGSYSYTLPAIDNSSREAIGYSMDPDDHENIVDNSIELDSDTTFYAQTRNVVTLTIDGNGNKINGENTWKQVKTGYNTDDAQTFELPGIDINDDTPYIIGYSNESNTHNADYSDKGTIDLSTSKTIYAQTKRDYEKKQAVFLKSPGIAQIGDNSNQGTLTGECTPETTYNGFVNDSCTVTSPTIRSSDGYKDGKWNGEYVGGAEVTISQPVTYFIAQTESNVYSVYYYLNGGEAGENAPVTYNGGTELHIPDPSRIGYSFSGWTDQEGEFLSSGLVISNAAKNYVLSAVWTPNIYTITFAGIDDDVKYEDNKTEMYPKSRTCTYEDVFTLDTPFKPGYTFLGWQVGNGTTKKVVTISKTAEDKTVTGVWAAGTYNIVYNLNGGENDNRNPESYTYSPTDDIVLYSGTRVGYHFDGWYTDPNFQTLVHKIVHGSHDHVVLHAKWTANTDTSYKVYHYQESLENSRTLKERENKTGTSDAKVTPAVKSYSGFDSPTEEEVSINPNGSTVLNYYYTRQEHSVTVNYAGGIDSNNDEGPVVYTGKYGTPVKELIPTIPGWAFSGWTINYPGTIPAEDVEVTATWKKNSYTITYNNVEYADNSGNVYGYDTNDEFDLVDASWTGYTFSGWYTDPNFTEASKITEITPSDYGNKVLYAKWTPKTDIKYTVVHVKQDLDQNYTIRDVEELYDGVTATTITVPTKNYPGFTSPKAEKLTINGDGSSEIEYTYARKRYKYTLEGAEGVDVRGSTSSDSFMRYDSPLTLTATVDTGYSWSGWYIKTGDNVYRLFTGEQNTTIGLPAYNSVVKPVVTHDLYTLSFDAHGGIATGTTSLDAQNHYYNDEITLPEVVRTGYIFQGWYTESNGQGTKYEADTKMPVDNVILHAYWIEGEVNVKVEYYLMNLDGSTYPEQPSDKLELQRTTNSTYTGEVKTYEGFKSPNEQSVVVAAEGTSVIKYYYPRISYSLDLIGLTGFNYVSVVSTNHPNGVEIISGEVQSGNYYYGETITITGELLTGYGMDKWNGTEYIGKNSGTPVFTFTMPAHIVTLTPNVTKNTYKAIYKDADRVIAVYDVVYEDTVPTPKAPSKYGYKFTGWRNYPISGTMPANNIELKAMWEAVPVSSGGGGGGGGSSSNDNKKTTNTTTGDKQQEHNSAELTGDNQKIDDANKVGEETVKSDEVDNSKEETIPTNAPTSNQSLSVDQEILTAYQWAYKHDVTTMPTLDEANPEGVVTRGHLAKMVVNYAINVLGKELPEKIPSECRWNDWRGDWESQEIKDYAVKACALGLMGLNMHKFQPKLNVTRAQFGTIMSRLLWGKKYAGGTPYYRKHLNALKENNIMTQIQNPEKRTELRQWVWLMLMRSAENK